MFFKDEDRRDAMGDPKVQKPEALLSVGSVSGSGPATR